MDGIHEHESARTKYQINGFTFKKKKSKTMKLQNNNKEMNYHFHQINTQMLSYLQERFLTSNSFPPFGIDAV